MPISGLLRLFAALALVGLLLGGRDVVEAQVSTDAPPLAERSPADASDAMSTAELERLKARLDQAPALDLNPGRLAFFSQVVGRERRTFADYVGDSDLMHGPTRGGNPMTHQEFLAMVTPRDFYSSGGITATELLQFAVTNYLAKRLLQLGLEEIREADDEQEAQQIRDRIQRELTILRGADDRLR